MGTPSEPVTLRTSAFGRASLVVAPPLMIGIGASGAPNVFPSLILTVGVLLLVSSLFFQPWSTTFAGDGIHRRCLLRRQTIPWDEVRSIIRTPSRGRVGGLMARTGPRRRHLLTDRAELIHEYDTLKEAVQRWAPEVSFVARPPIIIEQR